MEDIAPLLTLYRIRRIMILRAYNLRKTSNNLVPLSYLFKPLTHRNNGRGGGVECLRIQDIVNVLQITAEQVKALQDYFKCEDQNSIRFSTFINFLEKGSCCSHIKSENSKSTGPKRQKCKQLKPSGIIKRVESELSQSSPTQTPDFNPSLCSYNNVNWGSTTTNNQLVAVSDDKKSDPSPSTIPSPSPNISNLFSKRRNKCWKKHETIYHRHVTTYTTVHEDGTTETLAESETKQDDVVHLEVKNDEEETTFAHYEVSKCEYIETLNNEDLIKVDRGCEEYYHFKSPVDEFEFFDKD